MNFADKTEAPAWQCPDVTLGFAAIANCHARCVEPCCHCRFRHDAVAPDCGAKIVLSNDAAAVTDEIFEEIKDLRLDRHGVSPPMQLAAIGIKRAIRKQI